MVLTFESNYLHKLELSLKCRVIIEVTLKFKYKIQELSYCYFNVLLNVVGTYPA